VSDAKLYMSVSIISRFQIIVIIYQSDVIYIGYLCCFSSGMRENSIVCISCYVFRFFLTFRLGLKLSVNTEGDSR